MSIDSVGGGGRDPNEAARVKKMQEERAFAVKRAEETQNRELARMSEARDENLRRISESQESEIRAKQSESEERVNQAKSAADTRIRLFDEDSRRMTEEAKKQFQTKANALQRNAAELDHQRAELLKSHQATMDRLSSNTETAVTERTQRAQMEAAKAHIFQNKRLEEVNERGNFEVGRIEDQVEDRKRQAVSDGARKIAGLQEQNQEAQNQIESMTRFSKLEGAEQVQRQRENLSKAEQRQALEADDRMSRMNFENQRVLNRNVSEAKRKLSDNEYQNQLQINEAQKQARMGVRDIQNRASFAMNQLTLESDAQEAIARRSYAQQKQLLSEERDHSIADAGSKNEKLQHQLNADFDARKKKAVADKTNSYLAQLAVDEQELKFHRDEGKRQINNQVVATSERVATHAGRAQDPFYRVHAMGAQVEDTEAEVRIRLAIPEHEQDQVRLSLNKQNTLTLSGTRRYQENAKLEGGHDARTSTYQTFNESFQVKGKLDMPNMKRVYDAGVLTFVLPKG